ncbi:MAG: GNAT family N-acetyltransferase [Spirochaetales bacterium]|nr:GNAT family N-acetyltransferase [Spirochaetales bacterium]
MTIRDVRPGDEAALRELWRAFDSYHFSRSDYYFKEPEEREMDKRHRRYLSGKGSLYLLVEGAEGPVGFICGMRRTTPSVTLLKERRILELHAIAVAPGERGRGVAKALIGSAAERARAEGLSDLEVAIWNFNDPVQALVESLGFARISGKYGRRLG